MILHTDHSFWRNACFFSFINFEEYKIFSDESHTLRQRLEKPGWQKGRRSWKVNNSICLKFFNIPSFFVNYMLLKSLKSLECWLDILLSKEVIWCCFDNIHRMNKGIHNILRRGNVLFNHSSILSNLMYFNKRQTQYTTVARFIFYSYIQFIIHLEY